MPTTLVEGMLKNRNGRIAVSLCLVLHVCASSAAANTSTEQQLKLARYLVLGIGTAVVLIASLMGTVPGNILEATNKTAGLFAAPLFSLFFMALFVPFSTPFGAMCGALYGLVAAVLVAFWDLFTGQPGLSFQWIVLVSLAVSLAVGSLSSLAPTRRKSWKILSAWSALASAALVTIVLTLVFVGS